MKKKRLMLRFVGILLVSLVTTVRAAEFFVAPDGDDANPGSLERPFATPARGLRAARGMKDQPVSVSFRGGVYELEQPLTLSPDDSRTEKAALTLRAYREEQPVLSGGVQLSGWKVDRDGRWHLTLDAVKDGRWNFGQLFVADQRRPRPRFPATGYFKIASNLPPTEANAKRGFDRFRFHPADLNPAWSNLNNVEVVAFHRWSTSRLRPASVDPDNHVVTFTGPTCRLHYWADFETGHRYVVENVKEALAEPGQWYLDRPTGVLTYIPKPGEHPETTRVVAPRLEEILVLAGDPRAHRRIEHIRFEGLKLAHSNWACDPDGESCPQAAIHAREAIAAVGARSIDFHRCAIVHTGGYAIGLGAGCRNIRVEGCELVDLGGGGIKIGNVGGVQSWAKLRAGPEDAESAVEAITVRDCTIAHGGRIHPASVGVWIGHASHNTVEHNHIFDFYYSGLSVGWTWNYNTPSQAHHNDIGWNHVHQIGQRVLSDMGGIYTLGVSPGTRIHHNTFHDIESFSYGGWGLYTDEGSTGVSMDHNLVYNTKDGSFHQHYGRDNHITNNILVNSKVVQVRRTRVEEHRMFVFDRNIVYWTVDTPLFGTNMKDPGFASDNNLFWHAGKPFDFAGLPLGQWRDLGRDRHSIVADPLFVDPAAHDFSFRDDSPARQIGFESWDLTRVGRVTPRSLTQQLPAVPAAYE